MTEICDRDRSVIRNSRETLKQKRKQNILRKLTINYIRIVCIHGGGINIRETREMHFTLRATLYTFRHSK